MKLKARIVYNGKVYKCEDYLNTHILEGITKNSKEVCLYLDGGESLLKIGTCKIKKKSKNLYAEVDIPTSNESSISILLEKFKYIDIYPNICVIYKNSNKDEIDHAFIDRCILTYSEINSELIPYRVKIDN